MDHKWQLGLTQEHCLVIFNHGQMMKTTVELAQPDLDVAQYLYTINLTCTCLL